MNVTKMVITFIIILSVLSLTAAIIYYGEFQLRNFFNLNLVQVLR